MHEASFLHLGCGVGEVTIVVDETAPPPPSAEVLRRWEDAARANPRLFNGPILRFLAFDERARVIRAAVDTYQRYAMHERRRPPAEPARPERDVFHLAVTGVVTVREQTGGDAVLLGRRGEQTLLYPGMWEHAPGGGLDSTDVYGQLLREMEEELGLGGLADEDVRGELLEAPGPGDLLGLAADPNAPSLDLVVRVRVRPGAERRLAPNWEYGETRFVPVAQLGEFVRQQTAGAIIPPALALWRGMGWI